MQVSRIERSNVENKQACSWEEEEEEENEGKAFIENGRIRTRLFFIHSIN
jgi:hypothetical protein